MVLAAAAKLRFGLCQLHARLCGEGGAQKGCPLRVGLHQQPEPRSAALRWGRAILQRQGIWRAYMKEWPMMAAKERHIFACLAELRLMGAAAAVCFVTHAALPNYFHQVGFIT